MVSEWKDLDGNIIEIMQKWDLNTGGSNKKVASSVITSPGAFPLNLGTGYEKTFSFFTNRLYIEALLRKGKYEDFFSTCLDLYFTYWDQPSGAVFMRHIEDDGMEDFKKTSEKKIIEVNSTLEKNIITGNVSKGEQSSGNCIKIIKDYLCQVIRITAIFMKVSEIRLSTDIKTTIGKCLSTLSLTAPKLSSCLFEILEKGSKNDGSLR